MGFMFDANNRRPSNVSRALMLTRSNWRGLPRKQYTFSDEEDLFVVHLKYKGRIRWHILRTRR